MERNSYVSVLKVCSEFLPQTEFINHAFRQISPENKYCKVVHDDFLFPEWSDKDGRSSRLVLMMKYMSQAMPATFYIKSENSSFSSIWNKIERKVMGRQTISF